MAEYGILSQESYRELLGIIDWFSGFSLIPTLIGGWAVFVYNSYFGSVDIDLVGSSLRGGFLDIIERYERTHGYEEVQSGLGIESSYRKPIIRHGQFYGYVEIDACTYEGDTGSFHENPVKKLPYALCDNPKNTRTIKLDDTVKVNIPRKPLLFLYKLKAFRDRTFDLKQKGAVMSTERREWMQTKAEKDAADLIALLNPKPERFIFKDELKVAALMQLVDNHELRFALESLRTLPTIKAALDRHTGIEKENIEDWITTLLNKLGKNRREPHKD